MKTTKISTILVLRSELLRRVALVLALGLMVWPAKVSEAAPMGTAFTYQGRLIDANKLADGLYDFQFKLYDDPNVIDGNQVGSTIDINDLDVIDGYFAVELDFGSGIFTGYARWLETTVRPGDSNDPNVFVTLSPRQEVTPMPYALYAASSDWNNLNDIPAGFADGIDNVGGGDITAVIGGTGLSGGGTSGAVTLNVNFAGTGSAGTASRTDHNHDSRYYTETELQIGGAANVHWDNLTSVPAGFADGIDNVGGGGDITAVIAGTGLTGGGTSGAITLDVNVPLALSDSNSEPIISGTNSGAGQGVYGEHTSSGNYGILGDPCCGIYGKHSGTGNYGLLGDPCCGVYGKTNSPDGYAGYFEGGRNYFEGNVGIGTTSPEGKFSITTSDAGGNDLVVFKNSIGRVFTMVDNGVTVLGSENPDFSSPWARLQVGGNARLSSSAYWSVSLDLENKAGSGRNYAIQSEKFGNFFITDKTASQERLTISPTGNVGIGTKSPSVKLDVNGSVKTTEQITSTLGTGTAPLNVSSTTKCNNLNGDLLDGEHGSYYRNWNNLTNVPAGFADGIDNVGGLTLPYSGSASSSDDAFSVTNTGTGNAGWFGGDVGISGNLSVDGDLDVRGTCPYLRIGHCDVGERLDTEDCFIRHYCGIDGSCVIGGNCGIDSDCHIMGNLGVDGTLSKGAGSFKIDHPLDPENKYLQHSFIESPDMMNVYNGNVVLDEKGRACVELPDYFEALNRDFRYQLTCIGGFAPVYIAEKISDNRFKIAGGRVGMEVSWQVTGVRHDPYAVAHRIVVDEDKPAEERGYYLHPAAYGLPEEKGIEAVRNPGLSQTRKVAKR